MHLRKPSIDVLTEFVFRILVSVPKTSTTPMKIPCAAKLQFENLQCQFQVPVSPRSFLTLKQ